MLQKSLVIIALLFSFYPAYTQLFICPDTQQEALTLNESAALWDAGHHKMDISEILEKSDSLPFTAINQEVPTTGFTDHHYWLKFEVYNQTSEKKKYFLETGRPITDRVDLYLIPENGIIQIFQSGDLIPFDQKSLPHRKSIFPVELDPQTGYQGYIHYQSDGEVVNLPLYLRTDVEMISSTYFHQFIFGIFYGIIFLAVITYMFFYFAMKDVSFLFYCLYVISGGLLQFSLDGYFHQFLSPDGSWLGQHAVILSALLAAFFMTRYSQTFLDIARYFPRTNTVFTVIGRVVLVLIAMIAVFPGFLPVSYPIANILGLVILCLVLGVIVASHRNNHPIDRFFSIGMVILLLSFVVFILNNMSLIPNSFFSANIVKIGTGIEMIFLSLSMGNRIRSLKSEKEEMQTLALKKSEETNELKSYFLSNMSHELRTPLNAIMGMANLLEKELKDTELKHQCEVIRAASVGLLSSVNDILDFSKIDKGELRLENVPYTPSVILHDLSKSAKRSAEEKGLEFRYILKGNADLVLIGDPLRFSQMVNNVLGNAIKFTPQGSITLEVDVTEANEEYADLEITITDTGIGISEHKLNDIFEALTQEDISHKRKYGGFGLGLFITKQLVSLHQGNIRLESQEGAGTTCRISLRYQIQEVKNVTESLFPEDSSDLLGSHILVVEDNPVNQIVMKAILKKWKNTRASFANNGQEALDLLAGGYFDLILMDLQMPVMNGYEATEAIRAGNAGEINTRIPIIAITADVTESSRDRALATGMDDYQTKPVKQEALYKTITEVLSRSERFAMRPVPV